MRNYDVTDHDVIEVRLVLGLGLGLGLGLV